ncbi:MAG: GTP-binding protein [Pseudomonas marincola]
MTKRIPIILITGYLGAGKTTLINHLLSSDHGRRIAVLVNDFGAINIDASLIVDRDEQAISLANGCVCCSITDDLGAALDAQATRDEPPEIVVLEASGVAEPQRIALHAGYWPGFRLDATITLVDAETVRARALDKFVGKLVQNQIKAGDILILNKTDLVPKETCESLTNWISDLSPNAIIVEAHKGQVPPSLLMDGSHHLNALDMDETDQSPSGFVTRSWIPPVALDKKRLSESLDKLPQSIHRVKGFFRDLDTGALTLLQQVGRRRVFEEAGEVEADVGFVMIAVGSANDLELAVDLIDEAFGTSS